MQTTNTQNSNPDTLVPLEMSLPPFLHDGALVVSAPCDPSYLVKFVLCECTNCVGSRELARLNNRPLPPRLLSALKRFTALFYW